MAQLLMFTTKPRSCSKITREQSSISLTQFDSGSKYEHMWTNIGDDKI